MNRILAISDIHGCYENFVSLLDKVNYESQKDQLILLGDYIDRGRDSYLVVCKVKELIKNGAIALKGNHEQLAVDFFREKSDEYFWHCNGGGKTLESYSMHGANINKDIEFFDSLPVVLNMDSYIYVHAGLKPGIPLDKQKEEDMLWIRKEFIFSTYDWGKTIVFGHTPFENVTFFDSKIGIDTGCYKSGKLSCLEILSRKVYTA